ncbi:hypothetical protein U9M48_037843 [Paspalum notatum var. saurae]|uniref:Uncharacterized protein n=1 Tax=Paspalum notatum var. saurae TaxID=547442 RepID=A0AAQ3UGH7_PASNO
MRSVRAPESLTTRHQFIDHFGGSDLLLNDLSPAM